VYAGLTLAGTSTRSAHPLLQSAAALWQQVYDFQDETERDRCFPKVLVQRLRAAGLFRMLLPRLLGGYELDIPTCFQIIELMAQADGSVGWNLMNSSINQLASLAFPDAAIEEIYGQSPDQVLAGTVVPGGGHGRRVPGGFRVSGRWRFGSGCREASWMVGNFDLEDDHHQDHHATSPDGQPAGVYRVLFPASDSTVIDTWDVTGMKGTGSHDWTVNDVFVPEHRALYVPGRVFVNQWQRWPGTLYALPVHSIIGPHHSMIATGIARAGLDALTELASVKTPRGRSELLRDQPHIQDWIARAEAHLGGGRAYRDAQVRAVWDTVAAGQSASLEQCARCRLAGSFAADSARQAMDLAYRAAGTTATMRSHRLAHCWRDLQVVGQAAAVSPDWYPVVGRVLLGMEPGPRLVVADS
jgi:alkylation response protein AidB-like acyl-CoA dehydrogenase